MKLTRLQLALSSVFQENVYIQLFNGVKLSPFFIDTLTHQSISQEDFKQLKKEINEIRSK